MRNAARKLLGYLHRQNELSGNTTATGVITLDDGSIVRAAFFNGHPVVDYIPADEVERAVPLGCELAVECGMLDLGTNTASLGQKATFADAQPTIYFGDTCKLGESPLGGKLALFSTPAGYTLLAEKLPGATTSKLSDACNEATARGVTVSRSSKIHVQGRIQSSMFTGLMHKHVQAMYGCPQAVYIPYDFTLIPEYGFKSTRLALAVPALASTEEDQEAYVYQYWGTFTSGLIDPDGTYNYWFVRAFDTFMECVPGVVVGKCATELLKALRAGAVKEEDKARIEQYVLASLVPDTAPAKLVTLTYTEVVGFPVAFGWKFNERGSEMAMVVHDDFADTTQVVVRKIGYVDGELAITEENDGAPTPWFSPWDADWPGQIFYASPDTNATMYRYDIGQNNNWPDYGSFDAPVYCYYIEQTDEEAEDFGQQTVLEVVRSKLDIGASVIPKGQDACNTPSNSSPQYACYSSEKHNDNACRSRTREDTVSIAGGYYTPRASSVRVFSLHKSGGWVGFNGNTNEANHHNGFQSTVVDEGFDRGIIGQQGPPPYLVVNSTALCAEEPMGLDTYYGVSGSAPWFDKSTLSPSGFFSSSVNPGTSPLSSPLCDCPAYDYNSYSVPAYRTYSCTCPDAATVSDPDHPSTTYAFHGGGLGLNPRSTRYVEVLTAINMFRFSSNSYREKPTHLFIPCGNASAVAFREYDHHIIQGMRYSNNFTNSGLSFTYAGGSTYAPGWTMKDWIVMDWGTPVVLEKCQYLPNGGEGTEQFRDADVTVIDTGPSSLSYSFGSGHTVDPIIFGSGGPTGGQVISVNDTKTFYTTRGTQSSRGTWCETAGVVTTAPGSGTVSEDDGNPAAATGNAPLCGDVDLDSHADVPNDPLRNYGLFGLGDYPWSAEYDGTGYYMAGADAVRYYKGAAGGRVRFDDFAHMSSQKANPELALSWCDNYPAVAFPSFIGWA